MQTDNTLIVFIGAIGLLGACAEIEMPTTTEGRVTYEQYCAACHGETGVGDGPAAVGMHPAPANLTTIAAQNGGSFPRAQTLSTIDGYQRDIPAGLEMPEFGNLLTGETVPMDVGDGVFTPTPRALAALLAYLESIQR